MARLVPVDGNPFEGGPKLVPVAGNPFKQIEMMQSHSPVQQREDPNDTWRGTVSRFARPALEGGGAAVGGVIGAGAGLATGPGAPVASPVLGVAGGGLGYAIGKRAADTLDETLGLNEPKGFVDTAIESAGDVVTGAALEMGGAVLAPAFMAVKAGGKTVFRAATDPVKKALTKGGAERAAGEILQANTSAGPIYAKNAQEAAEIEKQIPGLKFTAGQRTNDPALIKLERSQMRRPGTAADISAEQIARNNEALRAYYQTNFGGKEGVDDLVSSLQGQRVGLEAAEQTATRAVQAESGRLPAMEPPQSGQRIVDTLQTGKNAARRSAQELYEQVPYEEVPTQKVLDTANAIRYRTSPELAGNIPERATFAAREYAADARMGTEYGPYADALMDEARFITTGEHGSKFVDGQKMSRSWTTRPAWVKNSGVSPDRAASALARASEGKPLSDFDRQLIDSAVDELKLRPGMAGYFDQQAEKAMFAEGKDIPLQRLVDFKSTLTDELRALKSSGANPRQERDLTQLVKSVEETLVDLERSGSPAAESVRRANAQYRTYKETYGQGTVGDILRSGGRGEKTKIPLAQIPSKIWNARNLSAADDLIKAAPNEASDIMRDHAAYDLLQGATDAQGNIVTGKLNGWLARNRPLLKKFGMEVDFAGIAKAQKAADAAKSASGEFEKSVAARVLNADPERAVAAAFSGRNAGKEAAKLMDMVKGDKAAVKGVQKAFADHIMDVIQTTAKDVAGNPVISNAAFQRQWGKYAPVMRVLYKNEPKKIAALNTMRRAYEVATRNTRSPIGGGSDTAENVFAALKGFSTLSRTANVVKGIGRFVTKHGDDKANELVNRALFDPDYAETLIAAARGKIPEKELQMAIDGKIVQLSDYRKARNAAAITGLGAASDVDE